MASLCAGECEGGSAGRDADRDGEEWRLNWKRERAVQTERESEINFAHLTASHSPLHCPSCISCISDCGVGEWTREGCLCVCCRGLHEYKSVGRGCRTLQYVHGSSVAAEGVRLLRVARLLSLHY